MRFLLSSIFGLLLQKDLSSSFLSFFLLYLMDLPLVRHKPVIFRTIDRPIAAFKIEKENLHNNRVHTDYNILNISFWERCIRALSPRCFPCKFSDTISHQQIRLFMFFFNNCCNVSIIETWKQSRAPFYLACALNYIVCSSHRNINNWYKINCDIFKIYKCFYVSTLGVKQNLCYYCYKIR